MATPDRSKGNRSRDELLAGEYVLGVLSPEARLRVEERLRTDRVFADVVRRWQDNLMDFEDDLALPMRPARTSRRAEPVALQPSKSGKPPHRPPPGGWWWNSLPLWRGLSAILVLMLLMVIAVDSGLLKL